MDPITQKRLEKLELLLFRLRKNNNNQINFNLSVDFSNNCLGIVENNLKNSKPINVDFLSPSLIYRIKHGGGKTQLLARAIGVKYKKLNVLDTTAGFGVDGFILAYLGCRVVMLERSPIIFELIKDGLYRLKNTIFNNLKMSVIFIQAIKYMNILIENNYVEKPDVIYIDPMYEQKNTSTALNKKNMRILRSIVGDDIDAPLLLKSAIKYAKKRVVVKRAIKEKPLAELIPDLQFKSKGSTRYDVYLLNK